MENPFNFQKDIMQHIRANEQLFAQIVSGTHLNSRQQSVLEQILAG